MQNLLIFARTSNFDHVPMDVNATVEQSLALIAPHAKINRVGTGLGLSLVNEIIQKHSGEITVESRPGRTAFTVKLPARTGRKLERRASA